jgi:hypothetical protein
LHEATLDRHGAGVYLPREAFRKFCGELGRNGLGKLYQVRTKDGAPAAAQLVLLGPHTVSHTACAGADPELNKQGASAFLRWSAFETLSALGYKGNDLTDASLNPVTHFKSQLGGTLELSLVLQSPRSRRYVWNERADTAVARARSRAGALVRRIARRGASGSEGSA